MKELQDVVDFVVALVQGVKDSLADGKIDWKDSLNFQGAVKTLPAAIKDIGLIDDQWDDRTDEGMAALVAHVREKFDIENEKLEDWIEDVAGHAVGLADLVDRGIDLFKKPDEAG